MKEGICCNEVPKNQASIIVGIDFGTTNCLISYFDEQKSLKFFQNEINHSHLFPSIITVKDNNYMFGCEQLNDCNQIDKSLKIVRSIKRIIGLSLTQIKTIDHELPYEIDYSNSTENEVKIFIGDSSKNVKEIIYAMMMGLVNIISKKFPNKMIQAVITVPAYFDEQARQIIRDMALKADIKVIRLINEPTAAAIAYINQFEANFKESANYLVYDLGGGTFDISILKQHSKNFFRVLAIGGDKYLGGDDIDLALLKFIFKDLDLSKLNHQEKSNLIKAAKKFKESFKTQEENYFIYQSTKVKITKNEFENIIMSAIGSSFEIMQNTISQAKLLNKDLTSIILVGGSTRLPIIKDKIQREFSGIKILDYLNPDEVVAMGAAIHAYSLIYPDINNHMLIDAIPLSLGIEVGNGAVEHIIMRNSPIPISNTQIFTTQIDNQSKIKINVCQGESDKFSENISLGQFSLINLPLMPALVPQIAVTFNIDADGILTIIAFSKENPNISMIYHF